MGKIATQLPGGRRGVALSIALVALIALAGCASIGLGNSGPTVSEASMEVSEQYGQPAMMVNYSTSEYSTVLLEDPEGDVVASGEVSPSNSEVAINLATPQPGEYTVALQQGGETEATKSVSFDGPDASVDDVEVAWSGNTIKNVSVTVQNNGDQPVRLNNASYSARGESVDAGTLYDWIDANSTETVTLSAGYSSSISIDDAGDLRGDVTIETTGETLSGEFQRTFEGPQLSISNMEQDWENNDLEKLTVTVENTGDLPTSITTSLYEGEEKLTETFSENLAANSTEEMDLSSLGSLYTAESGGSVTLRAVVNGDSGFVEKEFSKDVAGANVEVNSISPVWENGQLQAVEYSLSNSGDVQGNPTVELTVNGQSIEDWSLHIDPGESVTKQFGSTTGYSDSLATATTGGDHKVAVSLEGSDESASAMKTFEGTDGAISSVDTLFSGNYDSDTSNLISLDLQIQSTGDIPLTYDAVEVSIDGNTQSETLYSDTVLLPGESDTEYLDPDITVPNGEHDVTIRLISDGDVVLEDSSTISTED